MDLQRDQANPLRFEVLDLEVDAVDLESAANRIAGLVQVSARSYVCVTGVHGVMESRRRPEVAAAHHGATLVVPDGMPLVWCGRRTGLPVGRVYGPDLMLNLVAMGLDKGWRHALYGSSRDVLDELAARLEQRFPGIRLVGSISPPYRDLTEAEGRRYVEVLNQSGAHIVWVGLSTPKQELWMHRWRPLLEAPLLIGVGAAFDFHAGTLPQAPPTLQRAGLEWAYRLTREPRRLWRRYLRNNPAFVLAIARRPPRPVPATPGRAAGAARRTASSRARRYSSNV